MKVDVLGANGKSAGTVELTDSVFNAPISAGSVYYKLHNELANARQGTAKTKGRSEVSYTGRKPWKQKGTGRARAGDRRSPVWVGGGTVFGPVPRDYSYSLPKKIKQRAFRSILTEKLQQQTLVVVDSASIASANGKTKDFALSLKSLVPPQFHNVVLIIADVNDMVRRAARNIPWLKVLVASRLALKDLVYAQRILVTKDAAEKIGELLGQSVSGGVHAS